ncbi:hypothetical protein HOD25_04105 [archaeon]|nr:hypothetical protein [archaeon]
MSHAKNKLRWCLKKALEDGSKRKHRGLIRIEPDLMMAKKYIEKAEHYLNATIYLEKDFSDVSASTIFYSTYHSLLAVLAKFGYESQNQECTFAVIYSLIEDREIDLEKELIERISSFELDEDIVGLREKYQYGIELSMKKELFNESLNLARKLLGRVKEVLEE